MGAFLVSSQTAIQMKRLVERKELAEGRARFWSSEAAFFFNKEFEESDLVWWFGFAEGLLFLVTIAS